MLSIEEPCSRFRSATLFENDIDLLARPAWLNDSTLSFWCEVVEAASEDAVATFAPSRASAESPRIVCLQPAAAMVLLHETDAEDLAALAGPRGLSLSSAHALFAPVSDAVDIGRPEQGSHWTLLAWRRGLGFSHFDSGGGAVAPAAVRLAAVLAPMLSESVETVTACRCPAQRNGVDCGVHVAWAMETLALQASGSGSTGWEDALPALTSTTVSTTMAAYRKRMLAVANAQRTA